MPLDHFNASSRNQTKQDPFSSDFYYMILLFQQQERELDAIRNANLAEEEKQEQIAIARQKYGNVLREFYGIEDTEADPGRVDRLSQELRDIDTSWSVFFGGEKERQRQVEECLKRNGVWDSFQATRENLRSEEEIETDPVTNQPVIDATSGQPRTHRRFVNAVQAIDKPVSLNETRQKVIGVLASAATAAHVSPELMKGMWGVESTFGAARKSPTGCTGDWQFTRSTFKSVLNQYGDQIEKALSVPGRESELAGVKAFRAGTYNGPDLRDDSIISTYAAAFYIKDIAEKDLKISALDQSSFGAIYAAYNVGPGNAKKLLGSLANASNVGSILGSVATVNPMFYDNGETGAQALQNYQRVVERKLQQYNVSFENASPVLASTPTSNAFTQATTGIVPQQFTVPETPQKPVSFLNRITPNFIAANNAQTPVASIASPSAPATGLFGSTFNGAVNYGSSLVTSVTTGFGNLFRNENTPG